MESIQAISNKFTPARRIPAAAYYSQEYLDYQVLDNPEPLVVEGWQDRVEWPKEVFTLGAMPSKPHILFTQTQEGQENRTSGLIAGNEGNVVFPSGSPFAAPDGPFTFDQ